MRDMTSVLDKSVFGHRKAKRQIERIIAQWLNGDNTGYCFGFEGPPGVGKTSLAKKGISSCLKDADGVSRPFAFIAMGGSSNSSTLDGHNYTYVGSSWGRIVDILMDTKIMNPIIFIDELDKVSKTENGKEIIGILTHLIDQTQNDSFQDKYFNGINLNLSKALFIFSYNDADLIDRILLDRIHRIKFDHLTNDDKIIITREYILPEIYTKMGLNNVIEIADDVIEYIISEYTCEPGVRKLKELMFEIFGEINLLILRQGVDLAIELPYVITILDVKNKYLKERREMKGTKIHKEPMVGVINGLWANSLGTGGVLPIEASFYPCNTFLELNLTGMQGDVMKESMAVAKSLAWSVFAKYTENILPLQKKIEEGKNQGLHIHVPEGATPKDGPSAGTAITVVMYSLFSNRKIKNDVAITGEICLQGRVTAIGGLDLKILGGIKAGVKTFIYPEENKKDFDDFYSKYKDKDKDLLTSINFVAVHTIDDVIPLVFV
jgi:ATP-dependent Lon protease